jgi:uncharacterized membrane protein
MTPTRSHAPRKQLRRTTKRRIVESRGAGAVREFRQSVTETLIAGVLLILPAYVAFLLLVKAVKSLTGLVKPLAALLPDWFPAENLFSCLLLLLVCFLVGLVLHTRFGQVARTKIENSIFHKIPGYGVFRDMGRQMAGTTGENAWTPALVEIEEALVPAFIVEKLDDGRFTVFVPSVPTPLAGAIYILTAERVHPANVPFTQALKVITRWGSGAGDLVASIEESNPSLTLK